MPMRADISRAETAAQASAASHPCEYRISDRAIGIFIFLMCLGYLCLFLRYSAIELDEGIVLRGAERILNGYLPYRDFFTFDTPGSFYLVALLFRIFGDSF